MPARWSLRSKLVGIVALVLLPVLAVSAWQADQLQDATAMRELDSLAGAAELADLRYREQVEASRRLLAAVCADDAVVRSASLDPVPADVTRCEAFATRVLGSFPGTYGALVVTDEHGVGRCSTMPTAVGMNFADREIFKRVRGASEVVQGGKVASRISPHTVIPLAAPIARDGRFAGMCMLSIPLKALADGAATGAPVGARIGVSIVERSGVVVGGDSPTMRRLPTPARVAAAIAGGQKSFVEFGQDGDRHQFNIRPVSGDEFFIVASMPSAHGLAGIAGPWLGFALVVVALGVALLAIWHGADRWCVRPLRYIQDFADKVARGEEVKLVPQRPWAPEMASVGEGVTAMAEAIASREAALRAGLEQRDHMLREIHHRVKNNLQMISSLLNLQAGEIRSPRIRRFFGDAQNRVLTLSILHRHLYERSSWSLVDFQQFISDLVRQISVGRMPVGKPPPRYHIRAPIMAVGPDTAIPIGLIVTEAVGIALGHDFAGVATPEIRIEATESGGDVELVIEDNGVAGNAGMLGADGRGGFGLTLIRGLAMQLGGEADVSGKLAGGTRVAVKFPAPSGDEPSDG